MKFFFLLLLLFLLSSPLLAYASTDSTTPPRPGTVMIITFENGTTKVLRSSSTTVLPVTGGYFIVDPSVIPSQPLPARTVSQNIANQLYTAISIVYEIIIDIGNGPPVDPPPVPPPPPPDGCGEGEILQDGQCVPEPVICIEEEECPGQPPEEPPVQPPPEEPPVQPPPEEPPVQPPPEEPPGTNHHQKNLILEMEEEKIVGTVTQVVLKEMSNYSSSSGKRSNTNRKCIS